MNPRVERHPNVAGLATETLGKVRASIYGASQIAMDEAKDAIYALPASPDGDKAVILLDLLKKGVETYYLAGLRYTWISSYFTVPALSLGAYREVPGGPMAGLLPAAAQQSQRWNDCENGPDDKQIEVAIKSMQVALELNGGHMDDRLVV